MAYKPGTRTLVTLWLKNHIFEHYDNARGRVPMATFLNDELEKNVPKSRRKSKEHQANRKK